MNFENILAGKTTPEAAAMQNSVNLGFSRVELQLVTHQLRRTISEIIENVKQLNMDVVGVHTPLLANSYISPASLCAQDKESFFETCKLANACAELCGHPVYVVIHADTAYEQLEPFVSVIEQIVGFALQYNPNIVIVIENTTPISGDSCITTRNGYLMKVIRPLVTRMRNDLNTDRIALLFDTCHYIQSMRVVQTINNTICNNSPVKLSTSTMTEEILGNKDLLYAFHIANCISYGDIHEYHAAAFTDSYSDMAQLYELLFLIGTVNPKSLTIETHEIDYNKRPNQVITRESIIKCSKRIG